MNKLTIVGGGITGLVAGYLGAKSGREVRIIEGSKKFGGLLNTFEVGGTNLEYYYHHFFTHDAELKWLLKDLDLEDQLEYFNTSMGVFRDNKIYNFNSPFDLLHFKPVGLVGKLKFAVTSLFLGKIANWVEYENVPALKWFYKWAGKNVTNSLWKPLLDIKFGPYADKVPLAWMVGRLRQRFNSRKKGEEKLGYLSGSLKVLLDALLGRLKELNVELINDSPVTELIIENDALKGITTSKGIIYGNNFLFTIPTIHLTKIFPIKEHAFFQKLSEVQYFGAVCTVLELDRKLSNIYWLNIADEGYPFGGIIEHTNLISEKKYNGIHLVYLSRYFSSTEKIATLKEEEIGELMIEKLPKIYPGFDKSWIKKINVFKTNTAATVCDLNFSTKIPNSKTSIKNLYLANMCHVYPDERSVNNSIRVAAEACRILDIDTSFIPRRSSLAGQIGFNS